MRNAGSRSLAALSACAAGAVAAIASGQNFNIDFGPGGSSPQSSYRAAGLPGFWNSLVAANGSTTNNMRKLDGTVTGVSITQAGGTATPTTPDPALSGNDAALMNDHLVTFNANLESCLWINGLQNGLYEVIVYARMPAQPGIKSYTNSDEEPGNPYYEVGGAWTGQHVELVTYAVHYSVAGSLDDGELQVHSGIAPAGNPALGAALNGLQLRLITCDGDMDSDGAVGFADLTETLLHWGTCGGECVWDVNDDGTVGFADLTEVLLAWGGCA